MGDIMDNR